MKQVIFILLSMILFKGFLICQDTKKYTKVELKEVPELSGFKWSISISGGMMVAGFNNKFEKALIDAGYNKRIKLFTEDNIISYPHSHEKFGYSLDLNRWVNKKMTLSLRFDKIKSKTTWYNGYKLLFFDYGITSYTPLVKFTPVEYLFIGVGPAISTIKQNNVIENNTFNKVGLALSASLRYNKNTSRMFGFIDIKYTFLGSEVIGPYNDSSPARLSFPENKIDFSYGYVGWGLGLRL